ncbi:MAG TPA: EAL domain-containing protein [Actinomycetota bacterium]|nr:EAL domain-containing protein [Actinomycetota bacterium]
MMVKRGGALLLQSGRRPRVDGFALVVSVAGLSLLGWIVASGSVAKSGPDPAQFGLLVAFVVLGELLPIKVPRREEDEELTTSPTFSFALLISSGVAGAALALALAELCAYFFRRKSLGRSTFNIGQSTVALFAAAGVLSVLSEVPRGRSPFFETSDLPAILLAMIVFFLTSAVLTATWFARRHKVPVFDHLHQDLLFRAGVAGASLALAPVVVLTSEHSLPLIVLLLLPILALYKGGRQAALNEYQALHDDLTTLPNRVLLHDRIHQSILGMERDKTLVAVMLMDLDRFKEVNDTLGHHSGDLLLRQIGPRLRSILRESDTIARLGGDEFAILLPNVHDRAAAVQVADKIKRALDLPFEIQGLKLNIEASIGIAFAPDHGKDVESLIQRADIAMYVSKGSGSGYAIYAPEQDRHSATRLALVGQIRQAIDDQEISLYYQPKADLITGQVRAVEGLARWNHPERGLMTPDDFIPLTENTGLIEPLTFYLIEAAVRQGRLWRDAGLDLVISVNVSARSLLDHELPDHIGDILKKWNLPPKAIRLEITESTIMEDPVRALEVLDRLSQKGIGLALDDFGTGYSSLSYLKRLPVDELKIDKSFVMHMHEDENDAVIVRSTIDLGRNLGLEVVAEGVETKEHWDKLTELGCNMAQGYFLSRPIAPGEFMQWYRQREATLARADDLHAP